MIKNNKADIYEFTEDLDELLEQLRGWTDFRIISEIEVKQINKFL